MIRGSCLCGRVRYEADEVGVTFNCHCGRCRKWSGAAFTTSTRVPSHKFRIVSGEADVTRYPSSPSIERCFCRVCGSSLFTLRHDLGRVHLRLGSVNGDPGVRAQMHVYVGSKASWYDIADSLPQYHSMPPPV